MEAQKSGIKPIVGIDFRNGVQQLFVGIARNNAGFQEMNEHLSEHIMNKTDIPADAPDFKNAFIIYPLSEATDFDSLKENEYIGIHHKQLGKIKFTKLKEHQKKMVILEPGTFTCKKDFNTHRLLRAIDKNTLLSKLPESEQTSPYEMFYPKNTLLELFAEFPEIIANTEYILNNCSINFKPDNAGCNYLQPDYTGDHQKDFKMLKQLVADGLPYRYPDPSSEIFRRIEKELTVIEEKGFTSYFLINWDIARYAREKGYFYVGRGSGANSIVAYCLHITDVDPIELDLYFERFINLYRENPPDFDLDFSWKDRDDVTRYIFNKYGTTHTALLATYNTFQYRSTIRELGKVFGLPKAEIDHLTNPNIREKSLDEISGLVIRYSKYIEGFPSYLSVHAGGIIISKTPIHAYTSTELPPKGYPITQFSMLEAEDVGFFKFDILSQRGLGHIKDTLELIKKNKPSSIPHDIHDIKTLKEDERIKKLLKNGMAMGCFYVESPAMRMLMKKLRVNTYLELVAASSIIRPGVAKSGMMQEYIRRHLNPKQRLKAHPVMLEIMAETYGVMVYQEDVIKVAHHFADLNLAEADVLRRGMSGKYRSRDEFQKVKDNFFENCYQKGHSKEVTAQVWFQIESFAGYSFSKGHSASYAVESFQSLYLKAYYPQEFMVGVINNFGGFYHTEYYLQEARMWGAKIEAPCVNRSEKFTTIYDSTIFLGFVHIDSLEHKTIERIMLCREAYGDFGNLTDFVGKTGLHLEQVKLLIQIGAFRFTGKNKKELMWEAHFLLSGVKKKAPSATLFELRPKKFSLPTLNQNKHEDAFDQMELLGFPLCSPFELLQEPLQSALTAKSLPNYVGKVVDIYGYLVTIKYTSTKKREKMYFGTFFDIEGHWIDTVHFPRTAIKYPFRGKGVYRIIGTVIEEFGFYSINVEYMEFVSIIEDPRYSEKDSIKKRVELKRPTKKT